MKLTYRPDGSEEQVWEFTFGKLRTAETEAIEKRTGMDYDTEFRQRLMQGNMRARRALLWVFLRRQHHALPFDDVDFAADEVEVTMDRGEWVEAREALLRNRAVPEDERAMALAVMDQQIAELAETEGDEPEPGKAPESSGA